MISALIHACMNKSTSPQKDVQYMDLSDIFDFPEIMVSADNDMPSLEDIIEL